MKFIIYNETKIYYLYFENKSSNETLVFVHGAPGSSKNFISYLKNNKLQNKYSMISIDRLGYGKSNSGIPTPSIIEQANSINEILKKNKKSKYILIGHSFGAPIVGYLGYINDSVSKTIIIGGAVDSEFEKFVGLAKFVNKYIPMSFLNNDWKVATYEKLSHKNELNKISYIWENYPKELIVIHGKKDWLVSYDNLLYLKNKCPKENIKTITLKSKGHLFIFFEPKILLELLLNKKEY